MQGKRGPSCLFTCERCGREFGLKRWQIIGWRSGRFCSRACSDDSVGEGSRHWQGGVRINHNGYRMVRVGRRYVFEHRMVAADLLGRPLERHERVHHLNGDKLDNRPENLAVLSQSEHMRLHQSDPVWAEPIRAAAVKPSAAKAAAMRRRWADPEQREAMIRAIRRGKGLTGEPAQGAS